MSGDSESDCFGEDENSTSSSSDDSSSTTGDMKRCNKIEMPDHYRACYDNIDLQRAYDEINVDKDLVEKVISNYIVVKKILSYLPWQDKLICKLVNTTWNLAVQSLEREIYGPEDFALCYINKKVISFKKSNTYYVKPLAVLLFGNIDIFNLFCKCKALSPCPCATPCEWNHAIMDFLYHDKGPSWSKKDVTLTVRASYVSYVPLPSSPTYEHMIKHVIAYPPPFIAGVYIPKIPYVEYHMINIKSQENIQAEFFDVVDNLAQDRIFKGILVYVSEKYLLHSVESIVFLNYFKEVQPDIPYAMGGCIVEDTLSEESSLSHLLKCIQSDKDFVSENLVTLGIFTVPKVKDETNSEDDDKCNFDMFSLIVESSVWAKAKIQQKITEFSKIVPRYEHSVVLKLSCVGRKTKHVIEQEFFRAEFPDTLLVGCYGNGELGLNHPEDVPLLGPPVKRHRMDPGPQFGIMFSYSTIFVYMGWGKKTTPAP